VSQQIAYHYAIDMLDGAFARGDAFQFQLGIIMILDCCNEAIERGDCSQWWVDQSFCPTSGDETSLGAQWFHSSLTTEE
jgi:hypothetical protein